jgi:predicted metalloprotease
MRWQNRRKSTNIVDRRGMRSRGAKVGGGLGAVILVVLYLVFGGKTEDIPQGIQSLQTNETQSVRPLSPAEKKMGDFVSVVLADTEDVWHTLFRREGLEYREPKLVLFSGATQSACGFAQSATGPFYCPGDEIVYIDLDFLQSMQRQLGAPGDFAMAYVIAHEIGHHVQKLMGIMEKINRMRQQLSTREYNRYMIGLELQADFLAGIWAHHAQRMKNILEEGDIEEGINAAAAVGDDRIQKRSRGYVVPDSFTHGTSKQRAYWFLKGFKTGDLNQGNTFAAEDL